MSALPIDYPPEGSKEQETGLLFEVKNWCAQHGLTVRPANSYVSTDQDPRGILATSAPVTLFPSPFPRSCFEHARALQTVYNELYAAISDDERWLKEVLSEYAPKCHFTC